MTDCVKRGEERGLTTFEDLDYAVIQEIKNAQEQITAVRNCNNNNNNNF